MFNLGEIKSKLDSIYESMTDKLTLIFEESLDEVAMKRVVRGGRIVRKVKVKKKGFKVLNQGGKIKFVRMTQKEKRSRRKAARISWRTGKGSRKNKAKRTMIRSKVRMRQLYGR